MRTQDEERFREFVEGRRTALLRTAYLLCGDRGDAEDLTQATLIKVYAAWDRVARAQNPDGYVRRVLVNTHRSRTRGRRVVQFLTDRLPDPVGPDSTATLAGRSVLMAALARLPTAQRTVVVLRYWEDRSDVEVAHILGKPVGTVRSRAARGLARLREDPNMADLMAAGPARVPRRTEARS
ncbi:SigE family RNA polymerase sigma factor [Streptomyces sp. SID3343]|uniref:SigE family RNA polymerase sigma factor n=1 Tax=Streptomyces sp. SID3343 TaxID=2690260 RepID=UPI001369F9C0|nr:SigE family RNA polymerase sigma factor [Streptomyces sp. SID3343]MYW03198.1 SigE family RNA polymerase sigma factor [Streptomyces sp. SID3343]